MGFLNRILNKSSSNVSTLPNLVPSPPKGGELDLPPLPPEVDLGPTLPNLSPTPPKLDPDVPPQTPQPSTPQMPTFPPTPSTPPPQTPNLDTLPETDNNLIQKNEESNSLFQTYEKPKDEEPVNKYDKKPDEERLMEEYDPTKARLPLGTFTESRQEKEKKQHLGRREHKGPMFVKADDFRLFVEGDSLIKNNLKEAKNIITRLNELKVEEDKEFENWRLSLEEINKKIALVDKKIFELK